MLLEQPPPRRPPDEPRGGRAWRAAALAVVAAVLFGVLGFRLWALQVLRTDQYTAEARQNDVREILIPPPRGAVVDSAGRVMVTNKLGVVAQVDPAQLAATTDCAGYGAAEARCVRVTAGMPAGAEPRCKVLPEQARCRELARLGNVLGLSKKTVWTSYEAPLRYQEDEDSPVFVVNAGAAVTIGPATEAQIAYIMERRDRFPGVRFLRSYQRTYPWGRLGANVLGYVGRFSASDSKNPRFSDLPDDSMVGKDGVEYTYDAELRGVDGRLQQSYDASGRAVGEPYLVSAPEAGAELHLTIDARLQQAAQRAILDGIAVAHADGEYSAREGAVVAMNPKTGAIMAMASWPTYDPNEVWVPPYKKQDEVLGDSYNNYLFDRTTMGLYAPGSTFKPFTAAAAWWAGMIGPGSTTRRCTGSFTRPGDQSKTVFNNWDTGISLTLDLPRALEISCDTYFYQLGNAFYDRYISSSATDQFPVLLRRFGFGKQPGLDIPGAAEGNIPDPQWRKVAYGWSPDPVDREWLPGYDILMAIGQGDLQISPLQLATAYSALANGGTLVTPHVASEAVYPDGRKQQFEHKPQAKLDLSPVFLDDIRDGLVLASHGAGGTSTAVFGSFSPVVAGKTGTAEVAGKPDNAWYASWAPADDPKLVVVAVIVGGGHGGVSAAPVAREVYQAYFHPDERRHVVAGEDSSR